MKKFVQCKDWIKWPMEDESARYQELNEKFDFEHKASYCIDKIYQQVQMGLREDFPHY